VSYRSRLCITKVDCVVQKSIVQYRSRLCNTEVDCVVPKSIGPCVGSENGKIYKQLAELQTARLSVRVSTGKAGEANRALANFWIALSLQIFFKKNENGGGEGGRPKSDPKKPEM